MRSNLRDKIEICIRDNDSSIPSDILAQVFDAFFTTQTPGKGTGIGFITHPLSYRWTAPRNN